MYFYIFIFFALGAVLASFTGVIAERVYTGQSWLAGRSRCNSCRRTLSARDLVPIFSWIAHAGRCRTCKVRVPFRYALFELTLGSLFALSFVSYGFSLYLFVFLAVLVAVAFVVIYDLRHMIVPTGSFWLLLVLSAVAAVLRSLQNPSELFVQTVLTAGFIGLAFYALYFFSKGRAIGLGDAPVAGALSLLAGKQALAGVLFSFWIGALIGIFILALRRGGPKMGIEVPFIPFLAIGFLLAIFLPASWNPLTFLLSF